MKPKSNKKPGKPLVLRFVTSNPHKVEEAQNILKGYGIKLIQKDVNCDEIRAEDVSQVAYACAMLVSKKFKGNFVLEDSGLFVKALNGFPGVYSKVAYGKIGTGGILRLMRGCSDRSAQFRCSVALMLGGRMRVITGICNGTITHAAKGKGGFGYDPVFKPHGSKKTFAEDLVYKSRVSHRSRAFRVLGRLLAKKR